MKVCVGALVGDDREWVLGAWLERLMGQTVLPSNLCFVTGMSMPDWLESKIQLMVTGAAVRWRIEASGRPCYTRDQRTQDPDDANRSKHFTLLRNQLRALMLATDSDVFFSLDTDILLTNPATIEELLDTITTAGYDVASPLVHLSPSEDAGCYNAAYWEAGSVGDPQRVWSRVTQLSLSPGGLLNIDVPMAAVMMTREALQNCEYRAHEQGEDLGFADALDQWGALVAWRPDLATRHVWGPSYL